MELFTIGYEGRSLDSFFLTLRENHVAILCDVRNNPLSRKKGFSKKSLLATCELNGFEYRHYPMLGIESSKRKNLHSMEDYIKLFDFYRGTILPATVKVQEEIAELIRKQKLIALMCYEKDSKVCHRSFLADAISCLAGRISIVNL